MTSLLQVAVSISDQCHHKYLDPRGNVAQCLSDAAPGLQGLDFLNSTAPRSQIWLIEKATDGKNFLFRNYETGGALDVDDQNYIFLATDDKASQVWEANWLRDSALGAIYQIKNALTSRVLTNYRDGYGYYYCKVASPPRNDTSEEWLIKPILLPTLYWLTNLAVPALFLRMSSCPNALDNASRGIALVPKDLSARNQLWTFEYTSDSESILRNASDNQFVLDLSVKDSQTLLARKRHGGPNQRWKVKDEDENNHIVSLTNVKTNTLLATRVRKLSGASVLNTLAVVIEGNTCWQLLPSPRPPFFWVTIQNSRSGVFLTQAEDGSIVPSRGALHSNDHSVQWRFIMLDKDLQYVIVNRATGFMLQYYASATSEVSVVAKSNDRSNANSHWMLDSAGNTNVGIVNVGSKCVLDHYCGDTIHACDPGAGYNYSYRQWVILPFYDNVPSFALVNSHTGRCIANNPDPDVGTATTTDDVNDYKSQWQFYHLVDSIEPDPDYVVLNKMSGNVLEHYKGTRIEAHDFNYADPQQKWKLLPLRGRDFALVNTATQRFLYDAGESGLVTNDSVPEDARVSCWNLVSRRDSGFDFISWDFDILQRLLVDLSPKAAQELQRVIMLRLPAGEKQMKDKDKTTHIPRAARITRIASATLHAVFTRLIGQWAEDSIPETSQPRPIVSASRGVVQQQWGISLSERPLRRRFDEPGWVRIDLQGVYDVDGNWLANIQGQWLEDPVFQIIIPAGIHVGRAIIQRAMLQSLAQGLSVEVHVTSTSPAHTPAAEKGRSLGATPHPLSLEACSGGTNQLALTLGLITPACLKHDEPPKEEYLVQDD